MKKFLPFKVNKPHQKMFFISTPKKTENKTFSSKNLFNIKKPIEQKINIIPPHQKKFTFKTTYNPIKTHTFINTQNLINQQIKFKRRIKFRFSVIKSISINDKKLKKIKDKKKCRLHSNSINKENNYYTGRWKLDEHQRFIEAIIKFGNNWRLVQKYVKTRSSTQARSHAQKFFIKLKRAKYLNKNINLINSSIKSLHELLKDLNKKDYDNVIKELNNVAFDKRNFNEKKRKSRSKSTNVNSESSELVNNSNSDLFENSYEEKSSEINYENDELLLINKFIPRSRKQSFELYQEKKRKNSINSIYKEINNDENNINNMNINKAEKINSYADINENDYIKGFNLDFGFGNNNDINKMEFDDITNIKGSRKVSIDEDFIYNSINQ